MYEFFEHTADAGFRVLAADRAGLFRDAGRALFSLIVENLKDVKPLERRHLRVAGTDDVYLLFDWLDELLYMQESEGILLSEFDIELTEQGLEADVVGEPFDRNRHHLLHEVKAITYHALEVKRTEIGWEATVIVDI